MTGNNHLLWEDGTFFVKTPFNPHISYVEGPHVIVAPKADVVAAWEDPELSGEAFKLASKVSKVISDLNLAPWLNLQANGNWGLLPGATPFSISIFTDAIRLIHGVNLLLCRIIRRLTVTSRCQNMTVNCSLVRSGRVFKGPDASTRAA